MTSHFCLQKSMTKKLQEITMLHLFHFSSFLYCKSEMLGVSDIYNVSSTQTPKTVVFSKHLPWKHGMNAA